MNFLKLQQFFDLACPAQSAKLIGSNRVFHLTIHSDNAVVLLEIDAYLASCDVGQVEAKHLPCDLLFIMQLGENRDQLLTLAKFLKETVPVIFSVAQGELSLAEQTSLADQVMDEVAAQVNANPNLLGMDATVTVTRPPRRQDAAGKDKGKKKPRHLFNVAHRHTR